MRKQAEQRIEQAKQQGAQEAAMRKQAEHRIEQEALKTEKLAARLRQLNIDPDSI